ncbi:DivIVA domain-containing protein [Nocardioides sp. BE266]|uniref:DivIVA domain-containing protein n=1 Tax=Nocardioides sp. BE266 TaxID=2817725 RepID=UPI00286394B1|nr:DivIVA domain-containing protein [Nocardioides sp. BE266]MDR7252247.1 DivIVA domain-containing protein [Nocardioides sp. BE266]
MTLERPSFSTTSLREGYDMAEVDEAVDLILRNLALPELRFGVEQITSLRFTPVRVRQGYDIREVDSWLDEAAEETGRRTSGEVQPEPEPAPVPTQAEAPAPAPTSYAPTSSTAITEVKSGGAGLYVLVLAIVAVIGVLAYVLLA